MAGGGIRMNNISISGGADGRTPEFNVVNGELFYSFDNWVTRYSLGVIKGADGTDGADGRTGAKLVSQVLVGQDINGGNIYKQTFDDGTIAYFTAPRGEKGEKGDAGEGGGTSIEVDNALSEISGNPVQNKVITSKINEVEDKATSAEGLALSASADASNAYASASVAVETAQGLEGRVLIVEQKLDNKLNLPTVGDALIYVDSSLRQGIKKMNSSFWAGEPTAYTLPTYNINGRMVVGDAIGDYDAVNKRYLEANTKYYKHTISFSLGELTYFVEFTDKVSTAYYQPERTEPVDLSSSLPFGGVIHMGSGNAFYNYAGTLYQISFHYDEDTTRNEMFISATNGGSATGFAELANTSGYIPFADITGEEVVPV